VTACLSIADQFRLEPRDYSSPYKVITTNKYNPNRDMIESTTYNTESEIGPFPRPSSSDILMGSTWTMGR